MNGPSFGPWETAKAANMLDGVYRMRRFLPTSQYKPRCHVLREPEGFTASVEGPNIGQILLAKQIADENAAMALCDAGLTAFGFGFQATGAVACPEFHDSASDAAMSAAVKSKDRPVDHEAQCETVSPGGGDRRRADHQGSVRRDD